MVNTSLNPMDLNYNLSFLQTTNPIDHPVDWITWWNNALQGSGVFILLCVIGFVLFLTSRKFVESDTEALTYSGLIISIASLFLFVLKDSVGESVLGWGYFAIFLIITAVSAFLNYINGDY